MTTVQRIAYAFEDLYCTFVSRAGDAAVAHRRPVFGVATISYDGRGRWWISAIRCHDRQAGRPDFDVTPRGALWQEIAVNLERTREEEIAAAINAALAAGSHMALFDEHLPSEPLRTAPPPYVSSRLRSAASRVAAAIGAVIYSEATP